MFIDQNSHSGHPYSMYGIICNNIDCHQNDACVKGKCHTQNEDGTVFLVWTQIAGGEITFQNAAFCAQLALQIPLYKYG